MGSSRSSDNGNRKSKGRRRRLPRLIKRRPPGAASHAAVRQTSRAKILYQCPIHDDCKVWGTANAIIICEFCLRPYKSLTQGKG
jgi:hypothetical protein